MPNPKKYLAITADDYGPHPFINRGILAAVKEDLITSVGVLANPYYEKPEYSPKKEIETLLEAIGTKKIGVGVHLTMSSGQAITKEKKWLFLGRHDQFQKMNEFKFSRKPAHLDAVRAEIRAQIEVVKKVLDPLGVKIDHISSHNSLHFLFSEYFEQTLKAIDDAGIQTTVRSPLTISKDDDFKHIFKHSHMTLEGTVYAIRMVDDNLRLILGIVDGVKADALKAARKLIYKRGHYCGDYLFDNFYGHAGAEQLEKILENFPSKGDRLCGELMVHLGDGDKDDFWLKLHGIKRGYFKDRRNELKVLREFKFADQALKKEITLRMMRELRD